MIPLPSSVLRTSYKLADYETTHLQYSRTFLWTTIDYWTPVQMFRAYGHIKILEKIAGPFEAAAAGAKSAAAKVDVKASLIAV